MFSIYSISSVWLAIILGGIIGCVATAFVANALKGVPVKAVAGNWAKHVWSIIFMVPVPMLIGLPAGWIIAFLWLVLAPTIASKIYFGPKDLPFITLCTFHAGFAVAGLIIYALLSGTL
jgi:hypothetical protein